MKRTNTVREAECEQRALIDFVLADRELTATWKYVREWRTKFATVIGQVRADAKEAEAAGKPERAEALRAIARGRV